MNPKTPKSNSQQTKPKWRVANSKTEVNFRSGNGDKTADTKEPVQEIKANNSGSPSNSELTEKIVKHFNPPVKITEERYFADIRKAISFAIAEKEKEIIRCEKCNNVLRTEAGEEVEKYGEGTISFVCDYCDKVELQKQLSSALAEIKELKENRCFQCDKELKSTDYKQCSECSQKMVEGQLVDIKQKLLAELEKWRKAELSRNYDTKVARLRLAIEKIFAGEEI